MEAIKKAWKFKKFLKSDNIDEVLQAVNEVVTIYKNHSDEIDKKCAIQDFTNVENVDFNTWAYTQQIKIENLYNDLKSNFMTYKEAEAFLFGVMITQQNRINFKK